MASAPPSPAPTLLRVPSFHPATMEWDGRQQPRFIVVNPMHIISLQNRTRTFAVKVVEKIKSFSEKWFSHVLLLIFLLIYASLGALLFQWLEGDLETREKDDVIRVRQQMIKSLWKAARVDHNVEEDWVKNAHEMLKDYEGQLKEYFLSGTPSDSENTAWTFWGSLFFAGTVITTIGYGNICPATTAGRAATIIYAFIGIPFLLIVLADLGQLITRIIKGAYYYIKLFYHTGRCRKARKLGRRATAVPVQYMTVAWNKMPYAVYQNRTRRQGSMDIVDPTLAESEIGKNDNETYKPLNDNEEPNDSKNRKTETHVKIAPNEEIPTEQEEIETIQTAMNADMLSEEEFKIPVTVAIVMLLAYMMFGAFMFTLWEDWSFFESFYFVFISMSTVGFGDFVPDHPMFMMGAFIYLLCGLALTSMCINVIQEKLSATFEMAKLRIGTTMGLDASVIMEMNDPTKDDSPEKSETKGSRRGSKASPVKKGQSSDEETEGIDKNKINGIKDKSEQNHK